MHTKGQQAVHAKQAIIVFVKTILTRLLGCSVLLVTAALVQAIPPAPSTPAGHTVDVVQGVSIADPYRWLENWSDPKVVAWSDAQNARSRGYLDALPGRNKVKSALAGLIKASSPSYSQLAARGTHVFASYSDPRFQQPMLVTLDASADPASRTPVLDPNLLDAKGLTAIDWFVPFDDGSKVAISLSRNGSEDGTLHIYDVATAREIDRPIPRVQYPTAGGSLAWAADGKGFWYTRYPGGDTPEADQHFNMQVYFHRLGSDPKNDALALGTKDGLERVSEVFLDNRFKRPSVMARVQRGDGNIWAFYVLREGDRPIPIGGYQDNIVFATIGPDDAVYAISRDHASNGKILKLQPPFTREGLARAAGRGEWRERSELQPDADVRARHCRRPEPGAHIRSRRQGDGQAAAAGDRRQLRDREPCQWRRAVRRHDLPPAPLLRRVACGDRQD